MTFYHFMVGLCRFFFYLFNGKPEVHGLDNLPSDETVIFAATHRSAFDPFYLAIELSPRPISFMAKDSLFKWKWLANLLRKGHVFPVNRDKPSPKVIKFAVKQLTQNQLNLGIFPSGSRYSTQVKGGTAYIQRLAKKAIVPIAIQPPLTLGGFLKRQKAKIMIGQPIAYDPSRDYDKAHLQEIDQAIQQAFDQLDQALDPTYRYDPPARKQAKD